MNHYFGTWKTDSFTCPKCQTVSTGGVLQVGEGNNDLFELMCPKCDAYVTFVVNPTLEEYRANWDRLSELDKAMVERAEEFRKEYSEWSLKTAEQLPVIAGKPFTLVWSFESEDDLSQPGFKQAKRETVIRLGDTAIFREPAVYEGYERYIEIAEILRATYGKQILDLVPSKESQTYLYGDKLSAPEIVAAARKRIFGDDGAAD